MGICASRLSPHVHHAMSTRHPPFYLTPLLLFAAAMMSGLLHAAPAAPDTTIWIEGENPTVNKMNRHPWWYDQVKRDQLSGGDLISNWSDKPGEAEYKFTATK